MLIEITECPVCSKKALKKLFDCKDYTVSHETFGLIYCDNCQLAITSPRPSNEELGRYYDSEDYISHSNTSKTLTDKVYQVARQFTLNWKLQAIEKNSLTKTKLKILDFGCGTGAFLQKCKDTGHKVMGVEPSNTARAIAEGNINVELQSSLDKVDGTFDTITLWHVLEHVPDLNGTLEKLKSRLEQNGTMFIAVPNHQSPDAKKYKAMWAGYDVPRHLWHFSQRAMHALATKHNLTQVNVLPMKLDSFYVSLLSEKYIVGKQTPSTMIKAFAFGLQSNTLARKDNNYSSLIYIFRKK
jgi:2-polyprenyl-3-methyl-5-hydroxy-6-metoxy-1,4-benzoquinol methylase